MSEVKEQIATARPWQVDPVNRTMVFEGVGKHGEYLYIANFDSTLWGGSGNNDEERAMRAAQRYNSYNSAQEIIRALADALRIAKETIRAFNGLGLNGEVEKACWDAYQHSPEMKEINAALSLVSPQSEKESTK